MLGGSQTARVESGSTDVRLTCGGFFLLELGSSEVIFGTPPTAHSGELGEQHVVAPTCPSLIGSAALGRLRGASLSCLNARFKFEDPASAYFEICIFPSRTWLTRDEMAAIARRRELLR